MNTLIWCSSLVCAGVLTTAPAVETRDILPAAKAGFTLEVKGDSSPRLLELLQELQRVTGVNLVIPGGVYSDLSKSPTGLMQTLVVPQEKVHTLVETFLADAGYCTVLLHAEDPILVAVKRIKETPISSNAVFVDFANLASVEKHPALLCWTMIDLDAVAAGEYAGLLQSQWKEEDFRLVTMFGGTHRVLVMGKGKDVALRARVLHELNEAERRKAADAAKSSGGSVK